MDWINTLYNGDVLKMPWPIPDGVIQCVVTSPPYWGLRTYGTERWEGGDVDCDHLGPVKPTQAGFNERYTGKAPKNSDKQGELRVPYKETCGKCGATRIDQQLGLEQTPELYIEKMVKVFREVWRVLRSDGVLFLNMGDSYWGGKGQSSQAWSTEHTDRGVIQAEQHQICGKGETRPSDRTHHIYKPKDLCGIPWRLALALQADGWVLRSEIIWNKKNPMPESVRDRPTKSHEQIFLFSKAKWVGPSRRQFDSISAEDARWLALFLDTEGNVCAKRATNSHNGRTFYGTQICFASTNRALVAEAQRIIGMGSLHERSGKNAPMFYYQLTANQASDLLYRLYPYLIVKRRQAQLGIYLQEVLQTSKSERCTKPGRLRGRCRSDKHTALLERIWMTMKDLNHFGKPDLSWVSKLQYGKWDSQPYFYDQDAVREKAQDWGIRDRSNWSARINAESFGQKPHMGGENGNYAARGRNLRSVWTFATKPYPKAHFATFPPELPRRCILAGTSAKGACPECGAPWERIVERKSKWPERKANGEPMRYGMQSLTPALNDRISESQTLGWRPTCGCGHKETVPCVVLDPFIGAGTTAEVAIDLDRDFFGMDLNGDYLRDFAQPRVDQALKRQKARQAQGVFDFDLTCPEERRKT